jgi:hypothetical protein
MDAEPGAEVGAPEVGQGERVMVNATLAGVAEKVVE